MYIRPVVPRTLIWRLSPQCWYILFVPLYYTIYYCLRAARRYIASCLGWRSPVSPLLSPSTIASSSWIPLAAAAGWDDSLCDDAWGPRRPARESHWALACVCVGFIIVSCIYVNFHRKIDCYLPHWLVTSLFCQDNIYTTLFHNIIIYNRFAAWGKFWRQNFHSFVVYMKWRNSHLLIIIVFNFKKQ